MNTTTTASADTQSDSLSIEYPAIELGFFANEDTTLGISPLTPTLGGRRSRSDSFSPVRSAFASPRPERQSSRSEEQKRALVCSQDPELTLEIRRGSHDVLDSLVMSWDQYLKERQNHRRSNKSTILPIPICLYRGQSEDAYESLFQRWKNMRTQKRLAPSDERNLRISFAQLNAYGNVEASIAKAIEKRHRTPGSSISSASHHRETQDQGYPREGYRDQPSYRAQGRNQPSLSNVARGYGDDECFSKTRQYSASHQSSQLLEVAESERVRRDEELKDARRHIEYYRAECRRLQEQLNNFQRLISGPVDWTLRLNAICDEAREERMLRRKLEHRLTQRIDALSRAVSQKRVASPIQEKPKKHPRVDSDFSKPRGKASDGQRKRSDEFASDEEDQVCKNLG